MSAFVIPPFQIEPRTLPPPLLTSKQGSFAHNTLKVRVPRILQDTIESNSFPEEVRRALQELYDEIVGGRICALQESTPDQNFWNELSRMYLGRTWLDVPWYWAETFFYRRVLQATRYFQVGEMHGVDPYAVKKQAELQPEVAPRLVRELVRNLPSAPREQFEILLYSSLWGNRVDLSYNVARAGDAARLEDERDNLLVDDSAQVWDFLMARRAPHVAVLADNAGTELSMDLALIDFLLRERMATKIVVHLKQQPFFVSDAMPRDVEATLLAWSRANEVTRAIAERLRTYLADGRFELRAHWFYTTCLFYFQMPDALRADLAATDLVILKGDANYRRLLGDAHWQPTTSFQEATGYFPAPFAALRTLKAEVIVGLAEGQAESLSASDPDWKVNGKRGVVQANIFDPETRKTRRNKK